MHHRGSHTGITLIEVLVYIGLSSIIMLVMSSFMIHLVSAHVENNEQRVAQQTSREILAKITYSLRNAYTVDVYADATGMNISAYEYTDPEHPTVVVSTFVVNGTRLLYAQAPDNPPQSAQLKPLNEPPTVISGVQFLKQESSVAIVFSLTNGSHTIQTRSTIAVHQ